MFSPGWPCLEKALSQRTSASCRALCSVLATPSQAVSVQHRGRVTQGRLRWGLTAKLTTQSTKARARGETRVASASAPCRQLSWPVPFRSQLASLPLFNLN